jgi:glycosyltransferase involved in cell wall biosynthesis
MRVLHIDNEKSWRGGERQVFLTVQEQRRQGVDGWIACRRGSPLEEIAGAADIPTIGLANTPQTAWPALMRAARLFDVLHCHTGNALSMAVLATRVRRKPIVLSRRVDNVPHNSWFTRWKYQRVDTLVCASRCIALVLEDWGLPPATMRVIYEAVSDDGYLPRETCLRQLRERTGVAPGTKLIGNIAALVGHKDHATLLRASREIMARRGDVAMIVIGDGEMKAHLLQLRSELGLNGFVHFTGFIPQAQQLLPGFDVFTLSSRTEGLGSIVLDAGLAGVPVVATAAGGLPEAVLEGHTGLLAPVGDAGALAAALLRMLDEPGLAGRLAGAAQQRVRTEFTVAGMVQRYIEIYGALLARRRWGRGTASPAPSSSSARA